VARLPGVTRFLRQPLDEPSTLADSLEHLKKLVG
jgi:hypothetical protein